MTAEREVEVSFADILATLRRYKRTILFSPLVCGIAAYILVTFVLSPRWEGSAILQIGQIGQMAQMGQLGQSGKLVEPVANVVSRMLHPSFSVGVLKQANLKPEDLLEAKNLYENSLKVVKIKDADLVEIRLRGASVDMARVLVESSVSYLQKIHDDLMGASITRIKAQIQVTNEEIQTLKTEMAFLKNQLQAKHDWNSYNATLSATVLQDKANQLRDLTQRKLLLTEQLSPANTYTTKIIGDVAVSEKPVAPKKTLIISVAILLGLLGGILIAFVHSAVSRSVV